MPRHFGHPARPHIGLALEQDGAGDRLVVGHMDEPDRDCGFSCARRLRLNQLEAVVVGGGQSASHKERRGHEEHRADPGARVTV